MRITMKKTFKILVDCPVCAMKVEGAIKKIEGVEAVSVNFLMEKLVIEADEKNFDEILKKAKKAAKRIEPDCEIE